MTLTISLILAVLGLCLGSFAGAMVWRLRARQLVADKKAGEKVDAKEYQRLHALASQRTSSDRSRCLHCGYELRWYDLIPLISWLRLKGRCRECRKPIGWLEPLIELGVAVFFVASYLLWPEALDSAMSIALLAVWLASGVVMAILFAYDSKWYLLPDRLNFLLVGLGLASVALAAFSSSDLPGALLNALAAVGVLSGLYLLLYLLSKGAWVGFGDVKLGLGLGLLLGDWQLALLGLFLANLIGCLIVIPLLVQKKLARSSRIPFGPLLIAGAIIAKLVGWIIIDFYAFAFI
jgi:leader peptidase (prepilin peptidase)/N-methyltransferase